MFIIVFEFPLYQRLFALRAQSRSGGALSSATAATLVAAASCPIAVGRGALQSDRGDIGRRCFVPNRGREGRTPVRPRRHLSPPLRAQSRSGGAHSSATAASTDAAYQGVFYATIISMTVYALCPIAVGMVALQSDRGINRCRMSKTCFGRATIMSILVCDSYSIAIGRGALQSDRGDIGRRISRRVLGRATIVSMTCLRFAQTVALESAPPAPPQYQQMSHVNV